MFAPIRKWSYCVAAAALLPFATLSAQTFNFDFTTSGPIVFTGPNTLTITHNTITPNPPNGNPFNVTSAVAFQTNGDFVPPNIIPVSATFTWFTASGSNIFGTFMGFVTTRPDGSGINFANQPFALIGGTGIYTNLRGGGLTSGSAEIQASTSIIRYVGSAQIVPEPSTVLLMCVGLGALAIPASRRRGMRATIS